MTNAYDKIYLEQARKTMGYMLDFAVNQLGFSIHEFWSRFLHSNISRKFGYGDSSIVAGKSGIELCLEVIDKEERYDVHFSEEKSPEYWAGWALAYYQWKTGLTFFQINEYVPIDRIVSMYFPYHEMDIRHFCDRMNELIIVNHTQTNLKKFRTMRRITQKTLAEETGIPLRTIQQYEQGQKRINSARAEYVIRLAKALYCEPYELLEFDFDNE